MVDYVAYDMNQSRIILSLLAAPAVLCSTVAAKNAPQAIADYLPCDGTTMQGIVVVPARDVSFVELHRAAIQRFAQLPKEKQEAINAKSSPDHLMEYDADLWPDKAEYDKYVEAWKKTQLVRRAEVIVGLKTDDNNTYTVLSGTRLSNGQIQPLTISALHYDAKRNVWVSNNGELQGSAFSADDKFDFGAQTGNEWVMEKKGSLTTIREMLRITKTTDGKAVYLTYNLLETSTRSNSVIANHGYIILFPITKASANATRPGQK